jgi:Abnormal spindle-like microcephaly-assoc'd, ASPM-SPD-2-Hydin
VRDFSAQLKAVKCVRLLIFILLLAVGAFGQLTVTPSTVSFGNVPVGNGASQSVAIDNSSGLSLILSQASITGAGFSLSGLALPVTLLPGQSRSVTVGFSPQLAGTATGSISLAYGSVIRGHYKRTRNASAQMTVPLSGTGTSSGFLVANPGSLSFGSLLVGNSQTQSITLTNSGGTSVTVSQATTQGSGFSVSGLSLPLTLGAGQSQTFNVTFYPLSAGALTGNIAISSTASDPTVNISLSGTGVSPGFLAASPTNINVGNVLIGSTKTQSGMLTNTGGSSVTISQVTVAGSGFSLSGLNLPLTLTAGQGQTFSVVFSPKTTGTVSGNIAVASTASDPTVNISLSGTEVVPGYLSANPTSLNFGSVQVGSNQSQYESFANTGGASVFITQATVSGSGFSISGLNLPQNLNSGASITFTVTFAPTSAGSATGSISAVSNASDPNLSISLSGIATSQGQLTASPATGSFGNVVVGTSQSQTGTLSASGASVTVSSASSNSSEFTVSGMAFPLTLAPGQNATYMVTFTPQLTGTASASVTFASNASNSSATESLTGTGNAPPQHSVALSWSASTSVVSGYNVYRSSQSGGPYARMNSALEPATTYTDSTVQAGQTYFYVTTAVDPVGTESAYSSQVQAVIPTP